MLPRVVSRVESSSLGGLRVELAFAIGADQVIRVEHITRSTTTSFLCLDAAQLHVLLQAA